MILSKSTQNGFALPELIIVLLVTAILVTLALPLFSKSKTQFQRQNIVRELKNYLDRARFDSVKRHAGSSDQMAKVTINNAVSFSLVSDLNSDGTLDGNDIRQVLLPADSNVKIVGANIVFPVTISFNFRGQAIAVDGSNKIITPTFIVCDSDCTSNTANSKNSTSINISPSGTITLFDTEKPLLNANVSNVLNISADSKINQSGRVYN